MIYSAELYYVSSNARRWVRFTEGLRSPERQRELYRQGKSQTLNSYHLTGKAVDVALMDSETLKPDWTFLHYADFWQIVERQASKLSIIVSWGGNWKNFKDGVHFQIEDDLTARKHAQILREEYVALKQ